APGSARRGRQLGRRWLLPWRGFCCYRVDFDEECGVGERRHDRDGDRRRVRARSHVRWNSWNAVATCWPCTTKTFHFTTCSSWAPAASSAAATFFQDR